MKTFAILLVLGCGDASLAQEPAHPQPLPGMPNPDQFFQLPPELKARPQFKMQIPDGKRMPMLPGVAILKPPVPPKVDVDPGMILKPHGFRPGFLDQPSRPALSSKLYPDLKVLPIELARLEHGPDQKPAQWPDARMEPIPRTWPNAKLEPIPTTWEGYRMVPVKAAGPGADKKR